MRLFNQGEVVQVVRHKSSSVSVDLNHEDLNPFEPEQSRTPSDGTNAQSWRRQSFSSVTNNVYVHAIVSRSSNSVLETLFTLRMLNVGMWCKIYSAPWPLALLRR